MVLGTYEYTIDPKGRLFIPARLREEDPWKQGRYVITQGLERCLYLYDVSAFHGNLLEKLKTLPVKNQQDARAFKRMLLAGAQEVTLDDMGRILIAKPLVEYADLKKDVSILGVGERIELWSTPKWAAYTKMATTTFQRLGKSLEI